VSWFRCKFSAGAANATQTAINVVYDLAANSSDETANSTQNPIDMSLDLAANSSDWNANAT
jgi:hypothetical protein